MSATPAPSLRLYRLSGAGNDFLGLPEPAVPPAEEEIAGWCQRGVSLGADGLFLLRRRADGDVDMEHFNADGRPAELCLNGTRCAARLAHHLGWCTSDLVLNTGAGPVRAAVLDAHRAALELPAPAPPERRCVMLDGRRLDCWTLEVGVPHCALVLEDSLDVAPVASEAPRLRAHPDFGARGANVDYIRFLGAHALEVRTFERGVEAETLACGTGVLASVAVGLATAALELPVTAHTAGGFDLEVAAGGDGRWRLAGDARLLAELEVSPAALELPAPRVWRPAGLC